MHFRLGRRRYGDISTKTRNLNVIQQNHCGNTSRLCRFQRCYTNYNTRSPLSLEFARKCISVKLHTFIVTSKTKVLLSCKTNQALCFVFLFFCSQKLSNILALSVPGGYSRNTSCALQLISMLLFGVLCLYIFISIVLSACVNMLYKMPLVTG